MTPFFARARSRSFRVLASYKIRLYSPVGRVFPFTRACVLRLNIRRYVDEGESLVYIRKRFTARRSRRPRRK